MKKTIIISLGIVAVAAGTISLHAAPLSLDWVTIDGGGANSSGGKFRLSCTVGQADAGFGAGGIYVQSGGFWADAYRAVGPGLRIEWSGNDFILSWPATYVGFRLEAATDLTSGNWTDLGAGIQNGSDRFVSVPGSQGPRYFRLRKECP